MGVLFFFNKVGKKLAALLKFSYFTRIFQGVSLGPKHFAAGV